MNQLHLLIHRHKARHLRVHVVQSRLHLASVHLPLAPIFLAQVTIVAITGPAHAFLWAPAALEHVLKHMTRFRLEVLVVVGTAEQRARAL